jgi:hypothetical protein
MRGIVTALKWMSPKMATMHPVASIAEGMSEARRALEANGITRKAG